VGTPPPTGNGQTLALASAPPRLFRTPPPDVPGCYDYTAGVGWRRSDCDTARYISEHIPHPELVAGLGEQTTAKAGFEFTTVEVGAVGSISETDNQHGSANYSVQDNVFFTGGNHEPDGVQFTDQAQPSLFGPQNNICIWQVLDVGPAGGTVPAGNFQPTCTTVYGQWPYVIQGWGTEGVLFATVPSSPSGEGWWAVVAPDVYHLLSHDLWSNASGTILGYGNGSQAQFEGDVQVATTVAATTCLASNSLYSADFPPCTGPEDINNEALVGTSPGELSGGNGTTETNNLTWTSTAPVPPHSTWRAGPTTPWYVGKHIVLAEYVATTSGACFSGEPPDCGLIPAFPAFI
jgi:hypothetical protein